jgi:alpha-glucosidase
LAEADVAYEDIQDPYGKPFWPEYKGRDGCRTPMVWDSNQAHAGFSEQAPWLPVDQKQLPFAVNNQDLSEKSTLNRTRQLIKWRSQQPALRCGEFTLLKLPGVLAWLRTSEEQQVLVVINLSDTDKDVELPFAHINPETELGFNYRLSGQDLHLPAYQVLFAVVD